MRAELPDRAVVGDWLSLSFTGGVLATMMHASGRAFF